MSVDRQHAPEADRRAREARTRLLSAYIATEIMKIPAGASVRSRGGRIGAIRRRVERFAEWRPQQARKPAVASPAEIDDFWRKKTAPDRPAPAGAGETRSHAYAR
jgi:hypothetical protein